MSKEVVDSVIISCTYLRDHRSGMRRNSTSKSVINNEISPRLYIKSPVSSCHDSCKYGVKRDTIIAEGYERVPTHLVISDISDEDYSPKRLGITKVRQKGGRCSLKTTIQSEENVLCDSGFNNVTHLQQSDVSSDMIECMSEESVKIEDRAPLPFLKSILTCEQKNESSEDSAVIEPEAVPSNFDETISVGCVPWAWSDGSSSESVVMEFESPSSALESMACTRIPRSTELKSSSVEFEVTPQKMIVPASSNEARKTSNRNRSSKQDTLWKSMKLNMASSSKERKQVTVLKIDKKPERELPVLRSSLPMRTSLLGRVEAKKKVEVVEPCITNGKVRTLHKTVKSVKPNQASVIKGTDTSSSPVIIKKKPLSPAKIIQISPKLADLQKSKSTDRSPMIVSKTSSMLGEEKALKQIGASQVPKSTLYGSPGVNCKNLRSVKSQVEAVKVDGIREKTLHAEQKLIGVALKSSEKNHINPKSHQPARAVSSRLSMPSSMLALLNSKEENDTSQMTISGNSRLKRAQNDVGNWRTPNYDYKIIQNRILNVYLDDKSLSPGKLSSSTSSSMSSSLPSAFLSSSSRDDGDESKLIISEDKGSKKTPIGEKGKPPFYDYKIIKNVSREDKSLSPEKMSFIRGREVSLQKVNDDSRHKFMKEKVASEVENFENEIKKSSIRKSRGPTTENAATLCSGSPVVVLKHQDVQENNTRSLFNDVIEDTTNKLVEIRKSKVKALVGAFESIISLQEKKV